MGSVEVKKNIIQTSLRLFANKGYKSLSTKSLAKECGISEALLFKYFKSKENLLEVCIESGLDSFAIQTDKIVTISNPVDRIKAAINLAHDLMQSDYHFWLLYNQIRWQPNLKNYFKSLERSLLELLNALSISFSDLGYLDSQLEAELVWYLIQSMIIKYLEQGDQHLLVKTIDFVQKKYTSKRGE
jgi:AcrR family transcriptional regulator